MSLEVKIIIIATAVPTGLLYLNAIFTWVNSWYNFHWFVSIIIFALTIIIVFKPLLGAIFAYTAAVEGWGWSPFTAALLFFWWLIAFFVFVIFRSWLVIRQRQKEAKTK